MADGIYRMSITPTGINLAGLTSTRPNSLTLDLVSSGKWPWSGKTNGVNFAVTGGLDNLFVLENEGQTMSFPFHVYDKRRSLEPFRSSDVPGSRTEIYLNSRCGISTRAR